MNRVDRAFRGVRSFAGDVWVADYTEQTRYKPEEDRKAVVISEADLGDIGTFHLQNDYGVAFWGVNFEENKDFFPEGVQDCECMFKAKNVTKGGWLLLCELKYNLDKDPNNEQNAEKAYSQLKDTWNLLKERHLFNSRKCHTYLNIAMPSHEAGKAPFSAFLVPQDEQLKWIKKNKIHLMGYNEILIVNEGILLAPPPVI